MLLTWDASTPLPADHIPFVHLRRDGENVAQNDGPPRYFVESTSAPLDWRQLTVPADIDPNAPAGDWTGDWTVVIGLYNPTDGTRADLIGPDGAPVASELILAHLPLAPAPVPDQACALIPATCGSQTP